MALFCNECSSGLQMSYMSSSEFHRHLKEVFMCTQNGITPLARSQFTSL